MTGMTKVGHTLMDRFEKMLGQHLEDYQGEIVVLSLMRYYDLLAKDHDYEDFYYDMGIAIERVLEDYMVHADFVRWKKTRYEGTKQEMTMEKDPDLPFTPIPLTGRTGPQPGY